jgi:RNA polymerase sigma factor (sigma-70 family)
MAKTQRLTHAEEIELSRQLQQHEVGSRRYRRALDKLVTHNLGLVNKIVSRFPLKNANCSFDDLFQEGVAGLIHGIRKFDSRRGYRLSTYVYKWISVYVRRYYQNQGRTVRVPIHMADKSYQLKRQIEELTEKLGRTPTIEEIREVNAKADQIQDAMKSTVSLNVTIGEDSELESIVGEDKTEEFQIQHDAAALLDKIQGEVSNRDYTILVKRYGLDGDTPLTLSEVADKYEITRARVHQIEHKLLTKMRAMVS